MLVAGGEQVDAERFTELAADGRDLLASGDPTGARELFAQALSLWRGEALADFAYEPFAEVEVARLAEARLAATEDRIEADLALGRHRTLIAELEALYRQHATRERLLGQLMLAHYRSGRQADALEAYRRGRAALSDELGLEPGPELRALQQRILAQDPALDAVEQPAVSRTTSGKPPADARGGRHRGHVLFLAGAVVLLAAVAATIARAVRQRIAVDPRRRQFAGGNQHPLQPRHRRYRGRSWSRGDHIRGWLAVGGQSVRRDDLPRLGHARC